MSENTDPSLEETPSDDALAASPSWKNLGIGKELEEINNVLKDSKIARDNLLLKISGEPEVECPMTPTDKVLWRPDGQLTEEKDQHVDPSTIVNVNLGTFDKKVEKSDGDNQEMTPEEEDYFSF